MIPLLRPSCSQAEIDAVTEVLRSGWWGNGPKCAEFEERIAERHGYKYAVTVNSATAALHLALLASDIGPGDEVILPALTFVSTALAVSYVGAKPVFADIDERTLCIDLADAINKRTGRTKAIIPVDYAGYPAGPIDTDLIVVQDAAHAVGGEMYGDMVCFSFHPVKPLATGDGGAILLNDADQYERLMALRWCGINRSTWQRARKGYGWDYDISEVGYKCHWNDIQAAIGLQQLARSPEMEARRRQIAHIYRQWLTDCPGVQLQPDHPAHVNHLFPIRVSPSERDALIEHLIDNGYSAGVHYKPLTTYPMYKQPTPATTAREWQRLVSLPIYADMDPDDARAVASLVRQFVEHKEPMYA